MKKTLLYGFLASVGLFAIVNCGSGGGSSSGGGTSAVTPAGTCQVGYVYTTQGYLPQNSTCQSQQYGGYNTGYNTGYGYNPYGGASNQIAYGWNGSSCVQGQLMTNCANAPTCVPGQVGCTTTGAYPYGQTGYPYGQTTYPYGQTGSNYYYGGSYYPPYTTGGSTYYYQPGYGYQPYYGGGGLNIQLGWH